MKGKVTLLFFIIAPHLMNLSMIRGIDFGKIKKALMESFLH
ncbi:hypothetical protein WH7805_02797 [Synechococcus sp. WH 7805]|nr:hypothetical protein WH7805_02797 [Synechococcus sp. WH 7805]